MTKESVTLYFREAGSDKVYSTRFEEQDGGYVVNFAFGRRGSTLNTGTKTPAPVPFEQAKKIYDKLVKEKMAKGYSPGEDGTPYAHTEKADRDTGLRPQLLNPIGEDEVERYLSDSQFLMQEKLDGKRVLVQRLDGTVVGSNRLGLAIALPKPVMEQAKDIDGGDFIIDGEAIGERLVVFDCLSRGQVKLAAHFYRDRHRVLQELVGGTGAIRVLHTVASPEDKRELYRTLRTRQAEGVVFKDSTAPYVPGRPASGGAQLKLKFTATASVIVVSGRAGKRSVGLEVLDGGKRIPVGNVTIPGKQAIPAAGQIIEVKYLYAYRGGALYQPIYLDIRDDIQASACTASQLKYRREDAEDEA